MSCRRFTISGRVQGVFFRVSTRDVAVPLEIAGHAINKSDGNVEVLACGETSAIDELERWLHDGPPMASVSSVESVEVECEKPGGFSIS